MNKTLFIKSNQPVALEVLGYVLCAFVGFTVVMSNPYNWVNYVYATLLVFAVGGIYRILVAYTKEVVNFIKRFYNTVTTFFVRLAGKRGDLTPVEKTRYGVVGKALFIPSIMACISIPYMLKTGFDMNSGIGFYLLVFAGALMIFILDRTFVVTMGWKKLWHLALFRIIFAGTLGYFLSTPMILQLFHKETTEELIIQKEEKMNKLEKERLDQVTLWEGRIENAGNKLADSRKNYYEEVVIGKYTGRRGYDANGVSGQLQQKYLADSIEYDRIRSEALSEKFKNDSTYNAKKIEYQNTQSYGLGARLQALDAAEKRNSKIEFFHWLILAFLVMLDISPVLAKLLMPKSQSDRQEQKEEEASEHQIKLANARNKYELMQVELTAMQDTINGMDMSDADKERAKRILRNKISRNRISEEMFSDN